MALTQISTDGIKNGTITGSDLATNVDLVDNQKIRLGTGNDLQIYHDGSNSYLQNNTGLLYVRGGGDWLALQAEDGENSIICKPNGTVELYHDNSKKFETYSNGVRVHGELLMQNNSLYLNDNAKLRLGTGQDLNIFHDGTNSFIQNNTGNLVIRSDNRIDFQDAGGNESFAAFIDNGAVELYHDGTKKFETTSTGTVTTGVLAVNDATSADAGNRISVGTSQDIRIYHIAGNDSYFRNYTGDTYLQGNNSGTVVNNIKFENSNGATEIYFNSNKKFETTSTGTTTTGVSSTTSLSINSSSGYIGLPDNAKIFVGTGNDLQIYHNGTNSFIQDAGTAGS